MMNDLTNCKIGRLTIIKRVNDSISPCGTHHIMYLCKCDCGNEKVIRKANLLNGKTVSCGCYHIEKSTIHGMKNTRLYNIHQSMKQRCYGNHKESKNYKLRGIKICEEWLNNFQAFYKWAMNNGYSDNLTIDRINTNGDYEPSNCRWTTYLIQENNRRNNIKININNKEFTIKELSKQFGIKENSIRTVLRKNLKSIQKITKEKAEGGEYICFNCTRDMFQLKTRNV